MGKFLIILGCFVVVGFIPALAFTNDTVLFSSALAEGVGRTLAVAALACLGLLYRRNRTLGFGIAALTFSLLTFLAAANLQHRRGSSNTSDDSVGKPSVEGVERNATPAATPQAQTPVEAPVVQMEDIKGGVDEFQRQFHAGGFSRVSDGSMACLTASLSTPSWSAMDRCAAFDLAAAQFARGLSLTGGASQDQFFGRDLAADAPLLYSKLSLGQIAISERLQKIGKASEGYPGRKPITIGQALEALSALGAR